MSPVLPAKYAMLSPRPSRVEPVGVDELAGLIDADVLPAGPGDTVTAGAVAGSVTGATLRAQGVRPGDLFAALPGARSHGADFAEEAIRSGAVAVLTDQAGASRAAVRDSGLPILVHDDPRGVLGGLAARIYGNPSDKLAVLGVTGTAGKTTTTYLLDGALRAAGNTTGLLGTVETRVAGERLDSAFTTPEAPDLQALLAVMLERGASHVSMEVSSHALALGRVAGTRYEVGGFTNLSQDHLDFHSDLEDYFAAKAKLFDGRARHEVVCTDTEWGCRLIGPGTVTVSTVLTDDRADASWRAAEVNPLPTGAQEFRAIGPGGLDIPMTVRLPGLFNVANALLALAIAHAAGIDPLAAARGIAEVDVPGRMERVRVGQDFTAVVDYSHKPAAVSAVLDSVRAQLELADPVPGQTVRGRVIVVLGCGGDRDTGKRPLMGEAAARLADVLVVTDDNPRSEDPAVIRAAMMAGAVSVPQGERGEVVEFGDRREAITEAVRLARPGDVVVVAGKGHETGQEVAGVVHPFSDADELQAAIRIRLDERGQRPQDIEENP